jgi:pentatricopeptide repeat protein
VDLIVSNHGERPIYFNFTSINSIGLDLKPYAVQEGTLYRITTTSHDEKNISVDKALTYKYLIEEADYANLADPSVYFNYEDFHARMIVPTRQSFNALADAYLQEGNTEMAEKVLVQAVEKLYPPHLLPSYTNLQAADMLMALGQDEMAQRLTTSVYAYASDMVLQDREAGVRSSDLNLFLLQKSNELLKEWGKTNAASAFDSLP